MTIDLELALEGTPISIENKHISSNILKTQFLKYDHNSPEVDLVNNIEY